MLLDQDIEALVDRQLSRADEERVRNYINSNVAAKWRYRQLQRQKKLLKDWFKSFHRGH